MELWDNCVKFHGHVCSGLTIGYKAAQYAKELLQIGFSENEEIVCVTENDACGIDAISVILGCSVGKGNLLFRLRGKQAFSFFNRETGDSVRLVIKEFNSNTNSPEERQKAIFAADSKDLFSVKKPDFQLPENAKIFKSVPCDNCSETTAENHLRLQDGKKLCLDCFSPYTRFL